MGNLRITPYGLKKLKEYQGCTLTAVSDNYGIYSIGYGLTCGVKRGMTITQEQADADYEDYLMRLEDALSDFLGPVELRDHQWDAVVSFIESVGFGNFRKSDLCKLLLKNPDNPRIFTEFGRWLKAGNKVLPSLAKRRSWEAYRYAGNGQ